MFLRLKIRLAEGLKKILVMRLEGGSAMLKLQAFLSFELFAWLKDTLEKSPTCQNYCIDKRMPLRTDVISLTCN